MPATEAKEYMKVENGYLIVSMKLGTGRPSASGKTLVVATTGGFVPVNGSEVKVNLTAIKPH